MHVYVYRSGNPPKPMTFQGLSQKIRGEQPLDSGGATTQPISLSVIGISDRILRTCSGEHVRNYVPTGDMWRSALVRTFSMEDRASGHIIFGSKRGQPSEKRVTERVIPGARMKCKKIKQGPRRSASQDGAKFPSQWGSPMKISPW